MTITIYIGNTYCNSNGTLTCLGNECRCYFGYTGKYCETSKEKDMHALYIYTYMYVRYIMQN